MSHKAVGPNLLGETSTPPQYHAMRMQQIVWGRYLMGAEVALSGHASGVHARHNRLKALRLALIMRVQLRGHRPQLASLL